MPNPTATVRAHTSSAELPTAVALVCTGEGREPIERILAECFPRVLAFASAEELLADPADIAFSAIVMLIEGRGASVSAAVEPLMRRHGDVPIVLARPEIQRWEIRSALAAGACGVVLLDELDRALPACLQAVQAGQVCVPSMHRHQVEPPALSAREKQILGLVVMGYMNSEIAERLFLAESTVKSHLSSAFGKLGVRSRNEATSLILDPDRGLGMGILGLGGESIEPVPASTR